MTLIQNTPTAETLLSLEDLRSALNPASTRFATTDHYWDCDCREDYIHPRTVLHCPRCQTLQEDAPSSRLNEVIDRDLPLDLMDLDTLAGVEIHNTDPFNGRWEG